MICDKCGVDTPAPLENCISCSNPLPVPVLVGSSAGEDPTQLPTGFSAPPPPPGKSDGPLKPGDKLGRYRIDRTLGVGGMGHVYKAYDEELSESVALKVIRSEYAANSEASVRFKRELQLARQIAHKNVVRIFDLGEMNGVKYISMQFIDGLDLATMMKSAKLPLKLAVSIARQVAAGLSAAHDAGIVHRDLKPANVMIDKAGHAVLMDFGLARSTDATAFTAAGAVLGTLEYMSPEQARGETATARADIYALGLIYYEMFTGDRPFTGDTPMSRLAARVNTAAPNPRLNHPDLPEFVARIIEKCLERDQSLRYQAAAEIDADFDPERVVTVEAAKSSPEAAPSVDPNAPFPIGTVLAGRYELLRPLGAGAMGMVYQAFDRQLTRVVALKTILPELAASPAILKRFKQEVRLAQKVTHKNVVRIFDMGEDGGAKFITMDFIDGVDLKEVITRRAKLPPLEAVAIVRQVCGALEAAHTEGVTHRDLKPQNIMMEEDGHVVVMDFGIARSRESSGGTTTDAIVGTPEYMSPEQARSEEVDSRSDIFSLGLIFYELLTGKVPFKADSPLATMFKRTQEKAVPPAEVDSTVPRDANDIIVKCLERDRKKRYQSVAEILEELEKFDPQKKVSAAAQAKVRLRKASGYWKWVAACIALAIALSGGFMLRDRLWAPAAPTAHAPMTVMIADFNNHTGDTIFDGTLEPVVKMGLEGAGFITAYDRTQLRNLGLPAVSGRFDEQQAQKAAVSQGLGVVVTGSLDRQGNGYVLSMKATQAVSGTTIGTAEDTASNKDQVLFATTKLAVGVRKVLGDDASDSLFAIESLNAASLEAVHEYAMGLDAASNGKHEDALRSFSKAVDLDENFGVAYGAMAAAARNLGQQQDAEKYIKLALGRIDHMTERERYRTRAFYYLMHNDQQKCIEEYSTLISRFPSDATAHNNLAKCWAVMRNLQKALQETREAAAIWPKRSVYRFNISVYASYGSDFQTGEREARALLAMDPSYPTGPNALAIAQLGQGQLVQVAETYQQLYKFGKPGASNAVSGLGDLALYEGRFKDAAQMLETGAKEDLAAKYPDKAASKFAALAYTRLMQGQKGPAVDAAASALDASSTVKMKFLAGRVFALAGRPDRAQALAADLGKELQNEPQALAKLIEGEIALASGDPTKAIKAFTDGNNLLDTWIGRFDLGRAYLEAGAFTQADSEFDRCIKRRGEALELFFDDPTFRPTYGFFPPVYYYLGRVRQGMKSAGFAESYRTYLSIREKAGEDPLLVEVRKQLASQ